jgi:hypothetical protein
MDAAGAAIGGSSCRLVTRARQRKIYRIPKSISYIFVFIELETSSSTTTACHRQQQEP